MSDVVAVTEAVGVVAVADPVVDPVELAAAGEDVAAAATAPVYISTFAQNKTNRLHDLDAIDNANLFMCI